MSRSNSKQRTKQTLRRRRRELKRLAKQNQSSVGRDCGEGDSLMISCALCWDKVPKSDMLRGTVWGVTGNICKECRDYVGNNDFKESLVPAMQTNTSTYAYTSVNDWDWESDAYAGYGGVGGAAVMGVWSSCAHHMIPFQFQGLDDTYTVHLSGSSALNTEPGIKELPTVGVYVDDGWLNGRLASNDAKELDVKQPTALYVGWMDFKGISATVLAEAVEWVIPYVHNKQDIIEIACIGGHGRTGTFLAALLVREGWGPADAVEYIRGGYCKKAIESKEQEELIVEYHNLLTGVTEHEVASK